MLHMDRTYLKVQCNDDIEALSHIYVSKLCQTSQHVDNGNNYDRQMKIWYILDGSSIFIPYCHTLKILKVRCNPTNKNNRGLMAIQVTQTLILYYQVTL